MIQTRKTCYCAFCKNTRKVYIQKSLGFVHIIGLVITSFTLTYAVWQSLDPRGLLFLALLIASGEAFMQMKWRQSMICHHCGFDPVLYVKDPEKTAVKIKNFMDARKDKPENLLKPPVILPKRKVNEAQAHRLSLRG